MITWWRSIDPDQREAVSGLLAIAFILGIGLAFLAAAMGTCP